MIDKEGRDAIISDHRDPGPGTEPAWRDRMERAWLYLTNVSSYDYMFLGDGDGD